MMFYTALLGLAYMIAAGAPRHYLAINAGTPAESGWGMFTIDQGDVLLPTWYTFDNDGEATWFIVSGALPQEDGSYVGEVFRFTGVPFAEIMGNAADPGSAIGTARFVFGPGDTLVLEYDVEGRDRTIELERFDFGDREVACENGDGGSRAGLSNYTDLWWNPGQNGWGANLVHLDDTIYLTWYTYGADREAIWFLGGATLQEDGSYAGALFRGTTGTPYWQIDGQPPSTEGTEEVGSFRLEFSDGENGVMTTVVDGVEQSRAIERLLAGSNPPVCESRDESTLAQCFPQLQVDDTFRRITRISTNVPDVPPILTSRDQTVAGVVEYEGQDVFALETSSATLPDVPTARAFVADDGTARTTFAEDVLFIDDGSVAGTRSFDPPETIPSVYEQGVPVQLDTVRTSTAANDADTITYVRTWTLAGFESVEVFAGTFDGACRIEVEQVVTTTDGGLTRTDVSTGVIWAHPLVGEVKAEFDEEVTITEGGETNEYQQEVTRTLGRATVGGVDYPEAN